MLFCCLRHNVEALRRPYCDKQDSLMRGALSPISCRKQTPPLVAINHSTVEMLTTLDGPAGSHRRQSQMAYWSKIAFFAKLGGPRQNIAITFDTEKLKWCGYPTVKFFLKICLFASTKYTNVTDRRTDGQTDTARRHRPRLCIASHGKIA